MRIKQLYFLFLLALTPLLGDEICTPCETLIPNLKGIVLVPSQDRLLRGADLKEIEGLKARDLILPGSVKSLEKRLDPYFCKPFAKSDLRGLKNAILNFYANHYHPLVKIKVPSQEVTSGVLQLIVQETVLGEIVVEGNEKWGPLCCLDRPIKLKPGAPIDSQILMADLNYLNRNPYRRVQGILQPGKKSDTTDLLVLVEEGPKSYQLYAGAANYGIKTTKTQLYFAGFNLFNFLDIGHLLSYQYTTSNFHAMQAHTAQYMAPLPHRHVLNLYGGYSTYFPSLNFPVTSSHGYAAQGSIRYVIPLLPTLSLKSEVTAGFDFKATNTDVAFSSDLSLAPFHQTVYLTQWMASYSGFYQQSTYSLRFLAELFFSPFEWIPNQSSADYNALRPGAKNRWIYGRGSLFYCQNLPDSRCYITLSMRGQLSSCTLIPSEEFALGGYDTVRGYDQSILNQDEAILLSAEIRSPEWPIAKLIKKRTTVSDSFQILAFIDYSYGSNIVPVPGDKKTEYLAGIGPGARYNLEDYLACRVDWGIKLHKGPEIGESLGYVHFSVNASY